MKKYQRFALDDRYLLDSLRYEKKYSIRKMAKIIGCHHSTIIRELKRRPWGGSKYNPEAANHQARKLAETSHRRPFILATRPALKRIIYQGLKKRWSPAIIAGVLKRKSGGKTRISHESIYHWIYSEGRSYICCLHRAHRRRYPRYASGHISRSTIPDRVSIHQRPASAARREQPGHWEIDLVSSRGSRSSLQVIVDRRSRFVKLVPLPDKTAQSSYQAVYSLLKPLHPTKRRTLTYDNGSENFLHRDLNAQLKTQSFFCDPYAAWQKGTVENTNGLIRWFLPKGTDLGRISYQKIKGIERWLNNRPRKCLNFRTPARVFHASGALAP